jgi:hypothetical protein
MRVAITGYGVKAPEITDVKAFRDVLEQGKTSSIA